MRGLVIGGVASGAGKTTLSLALMAAYARRGLVVQAFKAGPDFIDPGHHALATGRPSHNLDGWMLSPEENRRILARHAGSADLAIVEGVMGLYDGFDPRGEQGSTAHLAKLLDLPVLLTVDARAMARSLAALARGFVEFDPELAWVGLAANRVGGPSHADLLGQAMEEVPGLAFLGGLPQRADLALPERHLGLVTAEEGGFTPATWQALADWAEQSLDLDDIWQLLPARDLPPPPRLPSPAHGIRLGVARDEAFCFYYAENLRHLEAAGARICFFSPLRDPAPPPDLDGLYLGGGYPELFARQLAANQGMRWEVNRLVQQGLPIYAECGGMMYLGQELTDLEGQRWPMAGGLPLCSTMLPRLRSLGYREVTLTQDCLLSPAGSRLRGHEFHYSEINQAGPGLNDMAYAVQGRRGQMDQVRAYRRHNVLASYVHLHLGSNPACAAHWVEFCHQAREQRR